MELLQYIQILWKRRRMILILAVTALLAGYFLTYLITETYEATAVVLVKPAHIPQFINPGDTKLLDMPVGRTMAVETPAKTYIEVIKSRHLREQIVDKLHLDEKEEATGRLAVFKKRLKDAVGGARDIVKYGRRLGEDPREDALDELLENLDMDATTDTYIFDVSYTAEDPEDAAEVANTAAEVFIQYSTELNQRDTHKYRLYLEERLKDVKSYLEDAALKLKRFKEKYGTFSMAEEYQSQLDILSDLETDLERNEVQLAGLLKKYAPSSPDVQSVMAEKKKLEEAIAARKAAMDQFPDIEKKQLNLELEADAAQSAYDFVRKEYHQTVIAESQAAAEIRIVSAAVPPAIPSKPKRLRYAAASLVAGLIVGIGLAFLLEYLDTSLRSTEAVEKVLRLPVLATIPRFSSAAFSRKERKQQAGAPDGSAAAPPRTT